MEELKLEHKDFIYLGERTLTVPVVQAFLEQLRNECFDQELIATPIVSESNKTIRPDNLTLQQEDYLDNAPYDFSDPVHESRFLNEFDFHAAFLRAVQAAANRVYKLKRKTTHEYYGIHAQYTSLYAHEAAKYGLKNMGGSNDAREAWFHHRYPALYEIDTLYKEFLNEVDIELERLQQLSSTGSRALAATENSYRARGMLHDRKVVSY